MAENKLVVRFIEEKDYPDLIAEVKPWDFTLDYLRWIKNSRPGNHWSLVVTLDGKIVGYCSIITIYLKMGEQILDCYRSGMFVHPEYRKKKYPVHGSDLHKATVFELLIHASHLEADKRGGGCYAFGTHYVTNHPLIQKKFRTIKTVSLYHFFLEADGFFENFLKYRRPSILFGRIFQPFWQRKLGRLSEKPIDISISEIKFFDSRFDALWEKVSKKYPILSIRDAAYLNWHFIEEPGKDYKIFTAERNNELQGYIILKQHAKETLRTGIIADLFGVQDDSILKTLLLHAVEYFKTAGMRKIDFVVANDFYKKTLSSVCFFKSKKEKPMLIRSYFPSVSEEFFYDPKNWFVTTSDSLFA